MHETESLPAPSKLPPGYDPRELQRIFEGKKFYVQDKHGKLYAVPMTNKKNSFKPAQKLRISSNYFKKSFKIFITISTKKIFRSTK